MAGRWSSCSRGRFVPSALAVLVAASAAAGCGGGGGGGGGGATGASAVIGPAGGTLTGNGVTLEVPPGALAQDTTITIGQATDVDTTRLPGGISAATAGPAIRFEPSGLRFARPARATVPTTGGSELVVALRDDVSGQIELLRPKAATGGVLAVELPHFSTSQPVSSQEAAPNVGSVAPAVGGRAGGTVVTVTGGNFRGGFPPLEVFVGGIQAPFAQVVTSSIVAAQPGIPEHATSVVFTTPRNINIGAKDVLIRNSDGPSVTIPGGFTYDPMIVGAPVYLNAVLPAGPIVVGVPFTFEVEIVDEFNVRTTASGAVVTRGDQSPALLSGPLTAIAGNGAAVFSGLTFALARTDVYLGGTSPGFPGNGVGPFTVHPGPATQLSFLTPPADGYSVGALKGIRVELRDVNGNPTSGTDDVRLTLQGSGTLGGTVTRTADDGVATFWDLTIDQPGSYSLLAEATGLTSAVSPTFAVTRTTPTWRAVGSMPSAHGAAAAASGTDGRIYVAGTSDLAGTTVVEAFDPRTGAWTTLPALPTPRRWFAMAGAPDGRIYVLGGLDSAGQVTPRVDAYTPGTSGWTAVADMQTPRAAFPAVVGSNGSIYAFFGMGPGVGAVTDQVEAFSPASGTWTSRSGRTQTFTRYSWAAAAATSGTILHTSGARAPGNVTLWNSADTHEYSVAGDAWQGRPQPDSGRWGAGAAEGPDGRIYLVGGVAWPGGPSGSGDIFGLESPFQSPRVDVRSPAGVWSSCPGLLVPRGKVAVVRGVDGRLYALGGTAPDGTALQSVEAYGPESALSPATGAPGTTVTVTGSNFGSSAVLDVYLGTTSGTLLASGTTDADGAVDGPLTFDVPAGTPSGTYTITLVDDVSGFPINVLFVVP